MKHVKLHNCVCNSYTNDTMRAQGGKFRDKCHLNFCRFCVDLGAGITYRRIRWEDNDVW